MPALPSPAWRTLVARHESPLLAEAARIWKSGPPESTLVVVRSAPQRAWLLRTLGPPAHVLTLSELFGLAGGEDIRDEDLLPDLLLDRIVRDALPPRFQGAHRRHLAAQVRAALHLLATHGIDADTLDGRGDLFDGIAAAQEALARLLPAYHDQGLFTMDERVLFAARTPSRLHDRFPTVRRILLFGIDMLSPMERVALVEVTRPADEVVVLSVGEAPGAAQHPALASTRVLVAWLGGQGSIEPVPDTSPRIPALSRLLDGAPVGPVPLPGVHIHRPYDRTHEIEEAVLRVAELLEGGVDPPSIAIVAPRLSDYADLLSERLAELGIPYATSHPGATRATPSGTFLRTILEALRDGLSRDAVLDVLDHPIATFLVETGELRVPIKAAWCRDRFLERGLDVQGSSGWSEALERMARPIGDRSDDAKGLGWGPWHEAQRAGIAETVATLGVLRRAPDAAAFFDGLRAFLDRSHLAHGVARAARDIRDPHRLLAGHARVLDLLDETEDALLGAPGGRVTGRETAETLLEALWRDPLPPQGDIHEGVQVLGWRNARGLRFEHVFVVGARHDALPPPDRAHGLRVRLEAAGTPRLEHIDPAAESSRILHGLVADTGGTVVLSCPAHEDDADVPASVLLEEVEDAFTLAPAPVVPAGPRTPRALQQRAGATGIPVNTGNPADPARWALVEARSSGIDGPWSGRIPIELAQRVPLLVPDQPVSASRLDMYARCPFRHLLQHGLGVRARRRRDELLDPADRGQVIHDILHAYADDAARDLGTPFRIADDQHAGRRLLRVATDRIERLPTNVHTEAFKIALLGGLHDPSNPYRDAPPGLLARFLAEERDAPARILGTEVAFGDADHPVSLQTPDGEVHLRGKIDRLDLVPDEDGDIMRVVDYKSGTPPRPALTQEGIDHQLPLYLHAARTLHPEHRAGAALYYRMRRPEKGHVGPERPHLTAGPDLDTFLDETVPRRIAAMARAARAGWHTLTLLPEDEAGCGNCDVRRACGMRPHLQRGRRAARLAQDPEDVERHGPLPDRARSL